MIACFYTELYHLLSACEPLPHLMDRYMQSMQQTLQQVSSFKICWFRTAGKPSSKSNSQRAMKSIGASLTTRSAEAARERSGLYRDHHHCPLRLLAYLPNSNLIETLVYQHVEHYATTQVHCQDVSFRMQLRREKSGVRVRSSASPS
jgi:hypothetical protein